MPRCGVLVEGLRAGQRPGVEELGGVQRDGVGARLGEVHLVGVVEHAGDQPAVAGADVGTGGDGHAGGGGAAPRHGPGAEELLRGGAVGDRALRLGEPGELGVGAVHGVGEDAAAPEQVSPPAREPGSKRPS